jgi:hypothetical protein
MASKNTPLLRCPAGSAGRYRVSLRVAHQKDEYAVQIAGHQPIFQFAADGRAVLNADGSAVVLDSPPIVTTKTPYEGELCEHELWFVRDATPGKDYRPEYEFTVDAL